MMKISQFIALAALLVAPTTTFGDTINGDAADLFVAGAITGVNDGNGVNPAPNNGNPGGHTLKIGSVNTNADGGRAPVLVFQLPDLGAVANPFTTASLTVGLGGVDAATEVNIDLYGLSRRSATPDIDFVGDYYLGPDDVTNATKLQDDYITVDTPHGTNDVPVGAPTDVASSAALLAFLNSKYEGGLGATQYVFLRLNVDGDMLEGGVAAVTGYNITTANDGLVELRPKIDYTTSVAPEEDADFDGDGDVDGADFLTWQRHVELTTGATHDQGDANEDGDVDGDDLIAWKGQFGAPAAQAVPEPTTIALALLTAAISIAAARRR